MVIADGHFNFPQGFVWYIYKSQFITPERGAEVKSTSFVPFDAELDQISQVLPVHISMTIVCRPGTYITYHRHAQAVFTEIT